MVRDGSRQVSLIYPIPMIQGGLMNTLVIEAGTDNASKIRMAE